MFLSHSTAASALRLTKSTACLRRWNSGYAPHCVLLEVGALGSAEAVIHRGEPGGERLVEYTNEKARLELDPAGLSFWLSERRQGVVAFISS